MNSFKSQKNHVPQAEASCKKRIQINTQIVYNIISLDVYPIRVKQCVTTYLGIVIA